jgi:hypothetical protein
MPSGVMLGVILPIVVKIGVIMPSVIMLGVIILCVTAPSFKAKLRAKNRVI